MAVEASVLHGQSIAEGTPKAPKLEPLEAKLGRVIHLPESWTQPTRKEALEGATVLPGPRDGLPTGLRGLNNLGNSCFMSSVLHAMLHAPLLRLYYLSGGHPRELCARRKQGLPCLSCELDRVVGEMYSGQRAPYSPVALLHAWWRHADHLAGYQQQDAHEFYLTTLCAMDGAGQGVRGMMHSHRNKLLDATGDAAPEGGDDKESIAESVFGGILRSDVTCQGCGHTSTAYDPFLDVSLDLHPLPRVTPRPACAQATASTASDVHGPRADAESQGGVEVSQRPAPALIHGSGAKVKPGRGLGKVGLKRALSGSLISGLGALPQLDGAADALADAGQPPRRVFERYDSWQQLPTEILTIEGTEDQDSEDGGSDFNASSSIVGGSLDLGHDTSSVPMDLDALSDGDAYLVPPAFPSPGSEPKPARGRKCGQCHTCLNPQFKKACIYSGASPTSGDTDSQASAGPPPPPKARIGRPPMHGRPPAGLQQPGGGALSFAGSEGVRSAGSRGAVTVGYDHKSSGAGVAASLVGCLHAFMKSEQLGSGERWVCDRCQSQQQAVKQMSIRRLPPVMCLHIKRFEHRRLNGVAAKVDTPLVFPVDSLDMAPFTSSAVLRARYSARSGPAAASGAPGGLLYELYAVVSHRGNLEGGHYITYLRVEGRWYQCDDAWIVPVEVDTVKRCQAYMLYYKRKFADGQA
mmetsp:Transcript_40273/g.101940  ORF Transcript_40273/g.101940 Transcript_40273/m.101940 type:complete len:693 (-) Transcript_40273:252-2330(-)